LLRSDRVVLGAALVAVLSIDPSGLSCSALFSLIGRVLIVAGVALLVGVFIFRCFRAKDAVMSWYERRS